jgi:hypothetical protein
LTEVQEIELESHSNKTKLRDECLNENQIDITPVAETLDGIGKHGEKDGIGKHGEKHL